jgi:hypothetical protein
MREQLPKSAPVKPGSPGRVTQTRLRANPEYQTLRQQLTDATIAERTQQAQIGLLKAQIAQDETRVAAMPAAQRLLAEKMRDYTVLKEQYEKLLAHREEAQIKSALDKTTARSMLSPIGVVAAEPSTSRVKLILMLVGGLAAGIGFGLGMVMLKEWTDPTVRYGWDVENAVGVPVLASLPDWSATSQRALPAPPGSGPAALPSGGRRQRAPGRALDSALHAPAHIAAVEVDP